MKTKSNRERGSLALEQVLFIGAIVTLSVAVYSFYGKLGSYFANFTVPGQSSTTQSSSS